MILNVCMTDQIHNEMVFNGQAQIVPINNGYCIHMNGNTDLKWKIYSKGMIIENDSDYRVVLTLKENSGTKGHIETEFGKIGLKCETSLYRINKNSIEIKYKLIQETDVQLFHFVLTNKEDVSWKALMFN